MTGITTKISIGLVALILFGAAQEFAIRLTLPAFDPSGNLQFTMDPESNLLLGRPGSSQRQVINAGDYDVTVEFNRFGLRDPRDISQGRAGDIYVVGDSFAFGWGVEEKQRFSSRLGALTDRKTYNLATPADFNGYIRLLEDARARGAKIQRIVLAVNMIDDIRDYDAMAREKTTAKTKSEPTDAGLRLLDIKVFMLRHSSLYFLATSLVHRVAWLKELLIRAGLITPIRHMPNRLPGPEIIDNSVRKLVEIGRRYNMTLLVIPSRGLWIGDKRAEVDRVHRSFIAGLNSADLKFIDLRPALEKGGAPMGYHFVNDGHWRPRGHELAARALAEVLKNK